MPTVRLQSSDGEIFDVDEQIAKSLGTIKTMLEDCGMDGDETTIIPLPNVKSTILRKVLEFAAHHKNDPVLTDCCEHLDKKRSDDIKPWDKEFLDQVDQTTLFSLILAANYLDTKGLMDAGCKTLANMIKGKTAAEIRETFSTVNDLKEAKIFEQEAKRQRVDEEIMDKI